MPKMENSSKMQTTPVISFSAPSFSIYSSSCRLNEIATRVVEEFRNESEINYDDVDFDSRKEEFEIQNKSQERHQIEDDDFEFNFVCREPETSPISPNDQIQHVYPLFNRDLSLGHDEAGSEIASKPCRMTLGKLMAEDRDNPSCSSSESDELDGLPPGTYCIWKPKTTHDEESTENCKKSNSTGSSKRWRFRNILHRSNSDVKESFVFLTPSSNGGGKLAGIGKSDRISSKQELFGFFTNVNGLSRSLRPF